MRPKKTARLRHHAPLILWIVSLCHRLDWSHIDAAAITILAEGLAHAKSLKTLRYYLSELRLYVETQTRYRRGRSRLCEYTHSMVGNRIGPVGAAALGGALNGCTALVTLRYV